MAVLSTAPQLKSIYEIVTVVIIIIIEHEPYNHNTVIIFSSYQPDDVETHNASSSSSSIVINQRVMKKKKDDSSSRIIDATTGLEAGIAIVKANPQGDLRDRRTIEEVQQVSNVVKRMVVECIGTRYLMWRIDLCSHNCRLNFSINIYLLKY